MERICKERRGARVRVQVEVEDAGVQMDTRAHDTPAEAEGGTTRGISARVKEYGGRCSRSGSGLGEAAGRVFDCWSSDSLEYITPSTGISERYKYISSEFIFHISYNMKYVILDFFVLATHTANAPCVKRPLRSPKNTRRNGSSMS